MPAASKTSSIAFPNMINVSQNKVNVYEDDRAIVNRSRLLLLTEPTELYNVPNFGVGLKKHIWTYNTENQKAIIQNDIKDQLRIHEPYCVAKDTEFTDGLLFTGSKDRSDMENFTDLNHLKMTCTIRTIYKSDAEVTIDGE